MGMTQAERAQMEAQDAKLDMILKALGTKNVEEANPTVSIATPQKEEKPKVSRRRRTVTAKDEERIAFVECANTRVAVFYNPSKTYTDKNGGVHIYKTRPNMTGLETKDLAYSYEIMTKLFKAKKSELVTFKSLGVGNKVWKA